MDRQIAATKVIVFVLCLLPAAHYGLAFWQDTLSANPVEAFTRGLGDWALYLLLTTLTITPLRRLAGLIWLMKLRRMLGLFAFFYICLHLTAYLWLDQFFDWTEIGADILKRPFITAGMLTFVLLIPLAATSSKAMIHRLGGQRWQQLHRLVYPAAMLAVLHFTWMVKADVVRPLIFGLIVALLLGLRLWWWFADARKPLVEQRRRIIPIRFRR
ncbi:MAG: sulfoxide reductase heme-binding subunit YedZ [Gammaproteobacteria bacterium]|nr:sulfoxide reductase heme-binding subunit YedZ [Gammaproteobacteria bacterium]MBU1416516.1 sulfoxide reductase heme-binding subunit YedZ [Gammaproteobacteria bacterium]